MSDSTSTHSSAVSDAPSIEGSLLIGSYIVFSVDPVATLHVLGDAEVDQAASKLRPKKYLGYVQDNVWYYKSDDIWEGYTIQLLAQGPLTPHADDWFDTDMCIPVKPNTDPSPRKPLSPTKDLPFANCYHYPQPSSILVRVRRRQMDESIAVQLPPDQEHQLEVFLEEDLLRKKNERDATLDRDFAAFLATQKTSTAGKDAASGTIQCPANDTVAPVFPLLGTSQGSPLIYHAHSVEDLNTSCDDLLNHLVRSYTPAFPALLNGPSPLPTYGTEVASQGCLYGAPNAVPTFEGPCDPSGEIIYDEMPEDDMDAFNNFVGCYQQAVRERDTLIVIEPSYDLSAVQSFAHPDEFFEEKDYLSKVECDFDLRAKQAPQPQCPDVPAPKPRLHTKFFTWARSRVRKAVECTGRICFSAEKPHTISEKPKRKLGFPRVKVPQPKLTSKTRRLQARGRLFLAKLAK